MTTEIIPHRPKTDLERRALTHIIAQRCDMSLDKPVKYSIQRDAVMTDDGYIAGWAYTHPDGWDPRTFLRDMRQIEIQLYVADRGDIGLDVYWTDADGRTNLVGYAPPTLVV